MRTEKQSSQSGNLHHPESVYSSIGVATLAGNGFSSTCNSVDPHLKIKWKKFPLELIKLKY